MQADINTKAETMAKLYYTSQRHTIQVDYVTYMDEIAEKVGCAPQIGRFSSENYCIDPEDFRKWFLLLQLIKKV